MLSLLGQILCVLKQIPYFIVWAAITAVNSIVAALGLLIEGLIFLLPPFPDLPDVPTQVTDVLGWINWFFPVGTLVSILATLATLWLAWQAIALALRWAKLIS